MENYCKENGYKRLKQLGVPEILDWYNDKLIYRNDFPNIKYWETLPSRQHKSINVPLEKVIGTNHIDYSNQSWIENLGCLKRFSSYYTKEHWQPYFESKKTKSDIHYIKYGNKFLIGSDGNHRTHIARFLGFLYIKTSVTEYFFDSELFNVIQEYQKEKLQLELNGNNLYRGTTWLLKIDNVSFYIHKFKMLKAFIHLFQTTNPSWFIAKKNSFLKKLGHTYERDFLHLEEEKHLNHELIKSLAGLKYNFLKRK